MLAEDFRVAAELDRRTAYEQLQELYAAHRLVDDLERTLSIAETRIGAHGEALRQTIRDYGTDMIGDLRHELESERDRLCLEYGFDDE